MQTRHFVAALTLAAAFAAPVYAAEGVTEPAQPVEKKEVPAPETTKPVDEKTVEAGK